MLPACSMPKFYCSLDWLTKDTILDWFKLKTFADNNLYVTENLKLALGRVENIMEKGKNAGYQHFLLFPLYFKNALSAGSFNPFPNGKF